MRWRISLMVALVALSLGCRDAAPTTPAPTATFRPAIPTATHMPIPTPTVGRTPTVPSGPSVALEGVTFTVELAVTPDERARGLMYRESLEPRHGMLFIFESDGMPGFWMRNMLISLDLVWIDSDGVVVGVTARVPPAPDGSPPPLYYPPESIRYVLEINAGEAQALHIVPGSRAIFQGIPLPRRSW